MKTLSMLMIGLSIGVLISLTVFNLSQETKEVKRLPSLDGINELESDQLFWEAIFEYQDARLGKIEAEEKRFWEDFRAHPEKYSFSSMPTVTHK